MDERSLSSVVEAVTLYRSGAWVRRVATLTVQAGAFPERIRLPGLPLALDNGSCRAHIDGGGVRALDLRVGLDVPEGPAAPEPPAEAELRAARAEEARIDAHLAFLREERERIQAVPFDPRQRPTADGPLGPPPTDARLGWMAFRRQVGTHLEDATRDAEDALREASRRRKELEAQLRRASTEREARPDELRKSVVITLARLGTGDVRNGDAQNGSGRDASSGRERVRIGVDYLVPGATWAPAYTLKLDGPMRRAELQLRAMVLQATGEDWRGAALTFSTAAPQGWCELPTLPSLRIGRRQPPPSRRGWRPPPEGAEGLFADYDRAFESPAVEPMDAEGAAMGAAESEGDDRSLTFGGGPPAPPPAPGSAPMPPPAALRIPAPEAPPMAVSGAPPAAMPVAAPMMSRAGGPPPSQPVQEIARSSKGGMMAKRARRRGTDAPVPRAAELAPR